MYQGNKQRAERARKYIVQSIIGMRAQKQVSEIGLTSSAREKLSFPAAAGDSFSSLVHYKHRPYLPQALSPFHCWRWPRGNRCARLILLPTSKACLTLQKTTRRARRWPRCFEGGKGKQHVFRCSRQNLASSYVHARIRALCPF